MPIDVALIPVCVGGLYYWTYKYSSPRFRNFLSWLVGYMNTISYITGVAGVDYACAVQIMAAVNIGTDLKFVPTVYEILYARP